MTPLHRLQKFNHAGIFGPRILFVILIFCALALTIPSLGLAPFSTKGEPREAIVSLQMLASDNWILPIDANGDMPYKPPMFQWCMAAASYLQAYSPEFSFRLPSALALVILVGGTFIFTFRSAPHRFASPALRAFFAGMLLLTASETLRAGLNARVDMLNTLFMCGAIFSLFYWIENKSIWGYIGAIICMSAAVLTKGPVGIILPAIITFLYAWRKRRGLWKSAGMIFMAAILSAVIPALWYYAAYNIGGDGFLRLVCEENFGRFLGKMSYSSHEKGLWYYFVMLPAGWLPWSILCLFALFSMGKIKVCRASISSAARRMNDTDWFAMTAAIVIFCFYCIPLSKRSVYLLPIYPFIAYFISGLIIWLIHYNKRSVNVFCYTIACIALLIGIAIIAAPAVGMAEKFSIYLPSPYTGILPLLAAAGILWCFTLKRRFNAAPIIGTFAAIMILYLTYFAFINPLVAWAKTDALKADAIKSVVPLQRTIYAHNPSRLDRWYSLTYYLNGRVLPVLPNSYYSNENISDEAAGEVNRISLILDSEGGDMYYLTSASQRGSEVINRIAAIADTVLIYESPERSADLKERPIVYRLTERAARMD